MFYIMLRADLDRPQTKGACGLWLLGDLAVGVDGCVWLWVVISCWCLLVTGDQLDRLGRRKEVVSSLFLFLFLAGRAGRGFLLKAILFGGKMTHDSNALRQGKFWSCFSESPGCVAWGGRQPGTQRRSIC